MANRNSALMNNRYKPAKVAELVEMAAQFWVKYGDDITNNTIPKAWGGQAAVLLGGTVAGAATVTPPVATVASIALAEVATNEDSPIEARKLAPAPEQVRLWR